MLAPIALLQVGSIRRFVDISVPRNIAANINELQGQVSSQLVKLYCQQAIIVQLFVASGGTPEGQVLIDVCTLVLGAGDCVQCG
jgi:hypothetical protein